MVRLLIMADARSVHTERWCRYFRDAGFEVALFSLEPNTIETSVRFYGGRRPTSIGVIDYWLAKRTFMNVLADFRPDIVNAHYVVSYGWLASFCRRCPVVVTAWGSDLLLLPQTSIVHRIRISRSLSRAAACTVDNENLRAAAAQFMSPENIVHAVMGVDRKTFAACAKTDFPSDGPLRVIAPRGLRSVYDPYTILDAAGRIGPPGKVRIDVLGDDPLREEYVAEVQRRGLQDIVTVKPFLPHGQFVTALKDYDVYLSASLSDSTSVALLEAMASGLFPVVSDIAGNREWIESGANGILFEPHAAAALAEAVARAAALRPRFAAVAERNRARVERDAIWEDNMERVKSRFIELAGQ